LALRPERLGVLQLDQLAAVAACHDSIHREPSTQLREELSATPRPPNNEGARRSNIDDVVRVELLRERRRAQRAVSANIHAPQEDEERHGPVMLHARQPSMRAPSKRLDSTWVTIGRQGADHEFALCPLAIPGPLSW